VAAEAALAVTSPPAAGPNLLQQLLAQTQAAANGGLYTLALFGAIAVPDICGGLESPPGTGNGARYTAWFDRNLGALYASCRATGADFWRFRCSLSHDAQLEHPKAAAKRLVFADPAPGVIHRVGSPDGVIIDVRFFVLEMDAAVQAWLPTVVGTEPYETNVQLMAQRYAHGLAPFIFGTPVVG
jgi:hypothetical protein